MPKKFQACPIRVDEHHRYWNCQRNEVAIVLIFPQIVQSWHIAQGQEFCGNQRIQASYKKQSATSNYQYSIHIICLNHQSFWSHYAVQLYVGVDVARRPPGPARLPALNKNRLIDWTSWTAGTKWQLWVFEAKELST